MVKYVIFLCWCHKNFVCPLSQVRSDLHLLVINQASFKNEAKAKCVTHVWMEWPLASLISFKRLRLGGG